MVRPDIWGILLGLSFIALTGGVFFWMFRLPPRRPRAVAKGHGSVEAPPRILVPIVDAITSERAVELACRLRSGQKVDLVLVHVIEVPDTLPLDVMMPDSDDIGREALEMGRVIARRYGCNTRAYIVHHRHTAQGILQVANEENVDAIVLSDGVRESPVSRAWGKTNAEILRSANCEVFLDEVPKVARPIALAVST
jgi:nucleotide-binding universal stress UspA family protein